MSLNTRRPLRCRLGLPIRGGLEVVEQVELEVVHERRRHLAARHVPVGIEAGVGNRGGFDRVEGAVEDHSGGRGDPSRGDGSRQVRVGGIEPHFSVQRADDEFANGDRTAVGEKGPDPEVGVDALDVSRVHGAVRHRRDETVADALRRELPRRRPSVAPGGGDGAVADLAQARGDLVGQHLLQAEAEQVRRVAAVGPRHDVSSAARRAARAAVASGAAVREAGADRDRRVDVAAAVVHGRPLLLQTRELSLEELAPPPDRAIGIAGDQKRGRVGCHPVSPAGADLFGDRLVNAVLRQVRRLGPVDHLPPRRRRSGEGPDEEEAQEGCLRTTGDVHFCRSFRRTGTGVHADPLPDTVH